MTLCFFPSLMAQAFSKMTMPGFIGLLETHRLTTSSTLSLKDVLDMAVHSHQSNHPFFKTMIGKKKKECNTGQTKNIAILAKAY